MLTKIIFLYFSKVGVGWRGGGGGGCIIFFIIRYIYLGWFERYNFNFNQVNDINLRIIILNMIAICVL